MTSTVSVRNLRSRDDFKNTVGDPRLTVDYFSQDFGRYPKEHPLAGQNKEWSVHLMRRQALNMPGWLVNVTGRKPAHLYLSIRDPNGRELTQIHGLPHNDEGQSEITGAFCNHLRTVFGIRDAENHGDVVQSWFMSGKELAVKLGNAAMIAQAINDRGPAYVPYLPVVQGVNSNTVARNMLLAMDLDLPHDVEGRWWNDGKIWAPGFANKDAFKIPLFLRAADPSRFYNTDMSNEQIAARGFDSLLKRLTPQAVSASVKRLFGQETLLAHKDTIRHNRPPILAAA